MRGYFTDSLDENRGCFEVIETSVLMVYLIGNLGNHAAMLFAGAGWDKNDFDAEIRSVMDDLYSRKFKPYVMA